MSTEEEIKELEKNLEEIRKAKKQVEESFSHVPDTRKQILMNLTTQESFLLQLIKGKRKEE